MLETLDPTLSHEQNVPSVDADMNVSTRMVPAGEFNGLSFKKQDILDANEKLARGLMKGDVLADLAIAEHTFAPIKSVSIVEADLPDQQKEGQTRRKTLLLGMELVEGQMQYVRGQLVDITDRLSQGDVLLNEEDTTALGLSRNTSNKITIAPVFSGNSLVVEHTGEDTFYLDVTSGFGENISVPQHQIPENQETGWDYTMGAEEAAKARQAYLESVGRQTSIREQIGRDRKIKGGEYTTANGVGDVKGEVIVVDDKYDKNLFEEYLAEIQAKAYPYDNEERELAMTKQAFDLVSSKIKYSQEGVDAILQDADRTADGDRISIGLFMEAGKGVCRHQALVLGRTIEKMIDGKMLKGKVSVDRNTNWNPKHEKYDGHAWVRYTSEKGQVYILDVAQGYFGKLENSVTESGWKYLRPEDKQIIDARQQIAEA